MKHANRLDLVPLLQRRCGGGRQRVRREFRAHWSTWVRVCINEIFRLLQSKPGLLAQKLYGFDQTAPLNSVENIRGEGTVVHRRREVAMLPGSMVNPDRWSAAWQAASPTELGFFLKFVRRKGAGKVCVVLKPRGQDAPRKFVRRSIGRNSQDDNAIRVRKPSLLIMNDEKALVRRCPNQAPAGKC